MIRVRSSSPEARSASTTAWDWAGGTRIGEAIKDFNYKWARRVLRSGATVVIISDGWDRGDPDLLAREMARLQRSCRRLIWLNPLLGAPGYQPLTQGMRAAMPYIDEFLPIHNLQSLEALATMLSQVEDQPPLRRFVPPPVRQENENHRRADGDRGGRTFVRRTGWPSERQRNDTEQANGDQDRQQILRPLALPRAEHV